MTDTAPASDSPGTSFDYTQTRASLFSSSTLTRIAALRGLGDTATSSPLDPPQTVALLRLLFDTHSFYYDRPSRRAAQACLASAIATISEPKVLAPFITAIRDEAQKPTIAAANAFVLVEWCTLLLRGLANTPLWDPFVLDIIRANAAALERCLQPSVRYSMGNSARILTRRGLRTAFWYQGFREKTIVDAVQTLTAKGTHPTAKYAPMLGVVAGVCARHEKAKAVLATQNPNYHAFFIRELVGSRTPLPAHIVNGLHDFYSTFITRAELEKDVIPPVEKGLLRAPEVVLDLVAHVLPMLSADIDLSSTLADHLLKPILSNVKSTNPVIRDAVLAAFQAAAGRSNDVKLMERVVDEVLTPLKSGKLATADQRVLHSHMLEAVPWTPSDATKIAMSLPPIAAKEGNEAALSAETCVLGRAAIRLLKGQQDVPKPAVDAFMKGVADKKIPARRLWILRTGDVLLTLAGDSIVGNVAKFVEAVTAPMTDSWMETAKNPAAAVQSGLITGAYAFATLALNILYRLESPAVVANLKKLDISKACLSIDPKESILLNHRIYSRLSSNDDFIWFLRSLEALYHSVPKASEAVQIAWSQAFVYIVSCPPVSAKVRTATCDTISNLYARDPAFISAIMIGALWQWVHSSGNEEKDSVAACAKFENLHLHLILRSICLSQEDLAKLNVQNSRGLIEAQMCALLVLARNELIPRCNWIDLCLKVGVDPGSLAHQFEQGLIDQLVEKTQFSQKSKSIKNAAYRAAADLAFVAPEVMLPKVISLIRSDLATEELQEIGPVEGAIFRTPEGTAFIDVLAKNSSVVPNKNTKDYDTLKWEEELRSQIAQKKGLQKKLSADDQAKVNNLPS